MTFPVTRSAPPISPWPDAVPAGGDTSAAKPAAAKSSPAKSSASVRNVKLLERSDQSASAMLRSLLSSPPPAVAAGARSRQEAAPVHEEVLLADTEYGRDFGGDNDTDWTGLEPINAFRLNASRINGELPDYFTFYDQSAVRDVDGYVDSKLPYKNGTVATNTGNYTSPWEFATALRKSIISTCDSQLSKGVGTPTYNLGESFGIEIISMDLNTAVGIGGPKANSSAGLNTILTGCVRVAYEIMTALPQKHESGGAEGEGGVSTQNIVAMAILIPLGLLVVGLLCVKRDSVIAGLKSLNPCGPPVDPLRDYEDVNGVGDA